MIHFTVCQNGASYLHCDNDNGDACSKAPVSPDYTSDGVIDVKYDVKEVFI